MRAYLRAYQATGEQAFADSARDTLSFVADVMTGPDGQFYSALDAETDAVEGAYYVWERSDVRRVLSNEQMALFDAAFALEPVPAFPGHKHPDGGVLFMRKPATALARDLGTPYAELRVKIDAILRVLKMSRDARKLPRLDDKVIAGWNGMMIGACAMAGSALSDSTYLASATRGAEFVLGHMRDEQGRLWRIWRQGVREQPAFQEDYAFLIQGLLALHAATDDPRWLESAVALATVADELFWDARDRGYFFSQDGPDLIARIKSISDGAIPSGNSAMLHNLARLWIVTMDDRWRQRVEQMLQAFNAPLAAAPAAHIHMVHALDRWLRLDQSGAPAAEGVAPPGDRAEIASPDRLDGTGRVAVLVAAEPAQVRPAGTFRVHADLAIEAGWHINANPASDPLLIPTLVDLRGDSRVEVVSVAYPDGRDLTARFAEHPIKVLTDRVRITLTARVGESVPVGSRLALNVFVQYQACDEVRCLKPAEQVKEVFVEVTD